MKNTTHYNSFNRFLAAACVLLAILLVAVYFYETSNAVDLTKRLDSANDTISQQSFRISQLEELKKYSESEMAIFRNPDVKTVYLKATNNKPENSLAIVCWNTTSKKTRIALVDLPEVTESKQFQVWAMVDGNYISLGLILTQNLTSDFFDLNNVGNPSSFSITLERKGGNSKPTIEELFVVGEL